MKLTLQLVVVALNARDNLFKFPLYTIIIYKVGDTRCHLRRHVPFQNNFFHEIRTPTETETCQDRRNGIGADKETNEAFPDRETNPTDFDKLEGYNPKRPRTCSAKKMRPGHCAKKTHPGSPGVTFLGTDASFAQSHRLLLEKYLIEGNCSS